MSNPEQTPSAEAILRAAQALTGEAPVAKAADADSKEPEDKKEEDKKENPFEKTEKGVTLSEEQLGELIQKAVDAGIEKATAAFEARLAPVTKSLDALTEDSAAIRQFQGASVQVLTNFKAGNDQLTSQVEKLEAISKSIQTEVTAIGDQPAAPRSVTVIEKAAEVAKAEIDMDQVNEIAKGLEVEDAVNLKTYAKRGDVEGLRSLLNPKQRRAVGL